MTCLVAPIAIAAILDTLDGRTARLLNAQSKFGAELDSLADIVSFGVTPAILLYLWALHSAGKSHLKQQSIASLEAVLDPARFVRIHRAAIVNLERVARIEPYGKESRIAILTDGTRLPVSRA